jgi:hypothetical protein
MGIGTSLFLITVGAILRYGVTVEVSGLDIDVIGVILMVVGAAGLVLSLVFWSAWGARWPGHERREERVVRRDRDPHDDPTRRL